MQYEELPLTLRDIRGASSNYLKFCLKQDLDCHTRSMMDIELNFREQRRSIT